MIAVDFQLQDRSHNPIKCLIFLYKINDELIFQNNNKS
jgi:hypothetical protein